MELHARAREARAEAPLLTQIYRQPTNIENFNRQPTGGPPSETLFKTCQQLKPMEG